MSLSDTVKKFVIILLIASAQTSALAAGNLEEGKKFYSEGRLDNAARCFSAELAEDPHDPKAHYLLANVFLSLHQITAAVQEYRKCAALDVHGQAGKLSRQALSSISPEGFVSKEATDPSYHQSMGNLETTGGIDKEVTRSSAAVISRETEERAKTAIAERDAKVQHILDEGDRRARALEKEMYERLSYYAGGIANVMAPTNPNNPGKYSNISQAIREEYTPQIEAIKRDTRRRADEVIFDYHARAAAIEDSAIALDKAYVGGATSMRLNPLGTNTYVRCYETADEPSGNAVPEQAPPARTLKKNRSI